MTGGNWERSVHAVIRMCMYALEGFRHVRSYDAKSYVDIILGGFALRESKNLFFLCMPPPAL